MTFKELLKKWNHGVFHGSQTALARKTGIGRGTIINWTKGNFAPSEDLQPRAAKGLGVTVPELMACFKSPQVLSGEVAIENWRKTLEFRGQPSREPSGGAYVAQGEHYLPVLGVINGPAFPLSKDQPALDVLPLLVSPRYFALRVDARAPGLAAHAGKHVMAAWADFIPEGEHGLFSVSPGLCAIRKCGKKETALKAVALILGFFEAFNLSM